MDSLKICSHFSGNLLQSCEKDTEELKQVNCECNVDLEVFF